jgi:ribonuclease HI
MFEFEELHSIAYKKERALSRRLSKGASLSEHDALVHVLRKSAAAATLTELVDARRGEKLKMQASLALRESRRAHARVARSQPAAVADALAWQAWFDGCAHPNPGRIGIGGRLLGPRGEVVEISAAAGEGDSCEAEYLALIAVLDAALECKPEKLVIHGDSQVVIDDIRRTDGQGAPALGAYAARARQLVSRLGEVRFIWIPRGRNGLADALSQQAVVRAAAAHQGSSRTSAVATCPNASLSA